MASSHRPDTANPRLEPTLGEEGQTLLSEALAGAQTYLEFGCGGSTASAIAAGVSTIVSVESDPEWATSVAGYAKANGRPDVEVLHADVGPTRSWGYPADDSAVDRWPTYAMRPWASLHAQGLTPDLVLIDGRFRLACLAISLLTCAPGTPLLFDDYVDRAVYHELDDISPDRSVHGRLVRFVVPEGLDRVRCADVLSRALYEPS